mgnify:CR=1 FL=1
MIESAFASVVQMLSFPFMVRAFIVGMMVALCAALLGVSLVLKRYAMIGDGLSHVGFATLAIATALELDPLRVSIPLTILIAFLLLRVNESSKIKGDSAIALISTGSLAVGVLIISISTGMTTDVCNYMFGTILAMSKNDVALSIVLSGVVLLLYTLFYHRIFLVTFDEAFARTTGLRVDFYNMLLAGLTAVTVVLGMRLMGALLITGQLIFPALTAMRLFMSFRSVILCAAMVSIVGFIAGLTISYYAATPAGGSVILVQLFFFLVFWTIGKIKTAQAFG